MVPLFGAVYAAPNKGTIIYTDLGRQKIPLNPPVKGKIQGLFKAFECFSSTFKKKKNFKDYSRQSCIFKSFSSLCEPCCIRPNEKIPMFRVIQPYLISLVSYTLDFSM